MKLSGRALALGAAVVIVAAGTFGAFHYASAQEGTSTPPSTATGAANAQGKRQQAVDAFLGKVATNLNIAADQLKSAVKDAALQTVDEQAAAGKLTADQATKIKDAINSGKHAGLARLFKARTERRLRVAKGIVESAAKAMNIQAADLKTELKAGKSIADVAGEHNVALDTVKSGITTDAQTKLNAAVQANKITQAQADAAMQKLTSNLDTLLNRHKGDKKAAPAATATPGA